MMKSVLLNRVHFFIYNSLSNPLQLKNISLAVTYCTKHTLIK